MTNSNVPQQGNKIVCTLDNVAYKTKPKGREIAAITRRMQGAGGTELYPTELAKCIAMGVTHCGAIYEPSTNRWGKFIGQQIFAIDIDNTADGTDEGGKPHSRDLHAGDEGFLDPWEALKRFRSLFGCDPLIMYPSFSFEQVPDQSEPPTKCKYRLMFDAGELIESESRARDVLAKLLRAFPEADPVCKNPNRLFFGSAGKAVCFLDGGAYYAKRD